MKTVKNCEGEYGKLFMQDLKLPAVHATEEAVRDYEKMGKKRIHWVDGNNIPGAFQLNTSWYFEANRELQLNENADTNVYTKWQTHVHDVPEMLCFYGSDPYDPYNLNGEIEIIIGDESHIIDKSTLIFVPAGVPHSTPLVNRVEKPIFHFSTVLSKEYCFDAEDGRSFEAV